MVLLLALVDVFVGRGKSHGVDDEMMKVDGRKKRETDRSAMENGK